MNMEHVITEFTNGDPARRHLVGSTPRSVSAVSWNREVRSINAFRRFCYGFFQPGKPMPPVAYGVQFKEDFDFENKVVPHEPVPMIEHATVFDFYKAIGFDYKTKRFAK